MFGKRLLLVLTSLMVIVIGTIVFVSNISKGTGTKALTYDEVLADLTWQESKDINEIIKEDTYTYTELTEHLVTSGLTQDQITNFIGERPKETREATEIQYALFTMNNFTYSSGKYILEARFSVGLEYTQGSSSPNRIISLGGAHVFTGKGAQCIFTGTIFYKLISGNSFYYSFYGDVYKSATTTVTIGEDSSIIFNASRTTDYLMNVSRDETFYSAGMLP